jgi:hypothetical protein
MFRLVPLAARSLLSVTELSVVKGRIVAEALLSLRGWDISPPALSPRGRFAAI